MPEQYANDATTTLASGITNSATSLTVASASGFPSTGNFRIRISNEILIVTAVSGTTFTVTRGAESTSNVAQAAGSLVSLTHTAGAVDAIRSDQIQRGTFANRPASPKAGDLYFSTDGPYLSHHNGSSWNVFGPLFKFTPPVENDFVWINQGSATIDHTLGPGILQSPAGDTSFNLRIRKKAAPATPWTLTAAWIYNIKTGTTNSTAGICVRQSSDGKVATLGNFQLANERVVGFNMNSATNFSATHTDLNMGMVGPVQWMRIADNGTNRIYSWSNNGVNWIQLTSVTRTSFLTADEIGFFTNNDNSGITLLHWLES